MPTINLKKLAGTLALASVAVVAHAEEPVLDIYLARHGQTAWNLEKRLQGATDNVLNETGKGQARQLGDTLKGVGFSAVYASSLARARETATLAAPGPRQLRPGPQGIRAPALRAPPAATCGSRIPLDHGQGGFPRMVLSSRKTVGAHCLLLASPWTTSHQGRKSRCLPQ